MSNKIKVTDLTRVQLDYAVFCAVYNGMRPTINIHEPKEVSFGGAPILMGKVTYLTYSGAYGSINNWHPSSDWEKAGLLIDKHIKMIELLYGGQWCAHTENASVYGETIMIAAMRAIVIELSGFEVDIPEELLE